jgi:hypothetical protein
MSGIFSGRSLSRAARSLRVRSRLADPLALLPPSWPDARWPTGPRAGRPAGVVVCKGAVLVRPLRGDVLSMIFD